MDNFSGKAEKELKASFNRLLIIGAIALIILTAVIHFAVASVSAQVTAMHDMHVVVTKDGKGFWEFEGKGREALFNSPGSITIIYEEEGVEKQQTFYGGEYSVSIEH